MNFTGLLGMISAIAVVAFTVLTTGNNPGVFKDVHGIVIVLGGTAAVALLCFPMARLFTALKVLIKKFVGGSNPDFYGTIRTIVDLAQTYRIDPKKTAEKLPKKCHPFLRDGVQALVEYGFSYDELDNVLSNALKGKKKRDQEEVKVWMTISRFPPAFGLLGATVGMIALLQTLGEPGAQDRVGPAMATALVATFYGLVTANLILIPISEKLSEVAKEDYILRDIIREGVLLIQEKKHPVFIEEYLKSFLSPSMRAQMQKHSDGKGPKGNVNAAA